MGRMIATFKCKLLKKCILHIVLSFVIEHKCISHLILLSIYYSLFEFPVPYGPLLIQYYILLSQNSAESCKHYKNK